MAVDEDEVNRRIEERMRALWRGTGKIGSVEDYREQARLIVATEDSQEATLLPPEPPGPEPTEPVRNLGEFPTLADQDEGEAFPSREFIPRKV